MGTKWELSIQSLGKKAPWQLWPHLGPIMEALHNHDHDDDHETDHDHDHDHDHFYSHTQTQMQTTGLYGSA